MKHRVLSLLFLIPALTACQFEWFFEYDPSTNNGGTSSGSSDITVGNFKIKKVEFLSAYQNNIRVTYTGDVNPFAVEGHEFDRLEINGVKCNWISPDHNNHRFETYAPSKDMDSLVFDFYDIEENIYIGVTYTLNNETSSGSDTSSSESTSSEETSSDTSSSEETSSDTSSSSSSESSSSSSSIEYPNGYNTLLWSDEFTGNSVDNSKWDYDIGTGDWGWGNGEMQYYRSQNATVSNGELHITAKKERVDESDYTSSRIVTRGKFSFKYGYIEAKIKLPVEQAMWPAFWMLPEDNTYGEWPHSGEIDIMEAKGRIATQSSSALHYSKLNGDHTYQSHEVNGHNIAEYHTYACEWKETSIKYYVDGALHLTVRNDVWTTSGAPSNVNAPFDQRFHIILNLAVGGQFDNWTEPRDGFTSADMVVDYVRVFQ